MTISHKRQKARPNLLLMSFLSAIIGCCAYGCNFSQDPADKMPYKNETNLTGKMLYERGDYYYRLATTTHFWQGVPETDPDEFRQAEVYYRKALLKGYRPKAGYDHLLQFYDHEGGYTGNFKEQEPGYAALIKAFPDSLTYWYNRALNRSNYKNYKGALADLNHILKVKSNYRLMEEAYYLRGAIKYVLNPKDTANAELDRMKSHELRKKYETVETYYVYCTVKHNDILVGDEDNIENEKLFKQQEAEYTAIIKAHPDSLICWYLRAGSRQQTRNYKGALQDFDYVLKPRASYPGINLEVTYYMRGAVKYRLNPKDTTAAEADRMISQKLHSENSYSEPYGEYCEGLSIPLMVSY